MGRVFFFFFFFQRFKNITQTSLILLFWQINNTIVFTLSTGRIVHGTICLELNCTLKPTRTVFSLVAMLNFYFRFRLISHSNVCQNSSASVARLKTFKVLPKSTCTSVRPSFGFLSTPQLKFSLKQII